MISIGLGRLAADYQHAIGAGNGKVEAISTCDTTHRGTYVRAAPQRKKLVRLPRQMSKLRS